jgi:GT2 family glycosyltransferase
MDEMKTVTVVIPNYNGDIILERNIPYVIKAARHFQESTNYTIGIVIVDDASTDQSMSVLEELKKTYHKEVEITILQNKKNKGFSSTVNKGVRQADSEYVVLLNTDVSPYTNFISPLIKHFDDQKMFAVGCLEKSIEGERIIERGRGLARWRRGLYIHAWGKPIDNSTVWVSGGSGMFRKSLWDLLGGMNELYNPFYWEDIDISYRAQKLGYKVAFEKNSIVTHKHSDGAIQTSTTKTEVNRIAFRNQFIFIWMNITDPGLVITHMLFLPVHVVKALLRFDLQFLYGFLLALLMLPKIIAKRAQQSIMIARPDVSLQLMH